MVNVQESGKLLLAREGFKLIEVKAEGSDEKEYILEGTISTIDRDKVDDIVSSEAQDDIVNQLNSMSITMDLDHESFRDEKGNSYAQPKNLIPVAKIMSATRSEKGTNVKAILNNSHPQFESILNSIKKGFLHSFSIAFTPVKSVTKIVDGVKTRVLDKINLLNIGITGVPINSGARFSIVTKSYINKMVEEINYEEKFNELKSVHDKIEADLKSSQESLDIKEKEIADLKSQLNESKEAKEVEAKSQADKFVEFEKQLAEVKSQLDKIRETPINKVGVVAKSEAKQDLKDFSVLSVL